MSRGALISFVLVLVGGGAAALPAQEGPLDLTRQVAGAVLPLPDSLAAGATVLGYRQGKLVELRAGTNEMVCLADDPAAERFQASCYHRSLEPFMARGRALRTMGKQRAAIDSARLADIRRGTLIMPQSAALYSVFAESDTIDPATVDRGKLGRLYVIYLPYATFESTGISTQPAQDRPWLMHPGLPWAHVMIPN